MILTNKCDDIALATKHMELFITKFVFGNKRERVRDRLLPLENNAWNEARSKLITWLEPRTCFKLSDEEKLPRALSAKYGSRSGLYFYASGMPSWLTLKEISHDGGDVALFSLDCGKVVFLFTQDSNVYVCKLA